MPKVRKHRDHGHERRDDGKAVEIYALHHAIHHITIYPRAKGAIRLPKVRNHMEANMSPERIEKNKQEVIKLVEEASPHYPCWYALNEIQTELMEWIGITSSDKDKT